MAANPTVTAVITAEDKATRVIAATANAIRKLAGDMEKINVNPGDGMTSAMAEATAAAQKQLGVLTRIKGELLEMTKAAGLYAAAMAAHKISELPHKENEAVAGFMPVEKAMRTAQASHGLSDVEMKALWQQHADLARQYGFKPEDVAEAQLTVVQRGMNGETTQALLDQAAPLAKALNTSLSNAAAMLDSGILARGVTLTNPEDAKKFGSRFADLYTYQHTHAGMSADDIRENNEYASSALQGVRISEQTQAAIAMALKKLQIGGEQSGVFLRQLSATLLQPTAKGRVALASAGINYEDYVGKGHVDVKGIDTALQSKGLGGLSEAQIAHLQKAVDEGVLKTSQQIQKAVEDAYRADHGKKNAQSVGNTTRQVVADDGGALDSQRLLDDILHKMSPQQIVAFMGSKQGAKLLALTQEIQNYEDMLSHASDVQGAAANLAEKQMGGVADAAAKYSATVEASENSFVQANSKLVTSLIHAATAVADWAGDLSPTTKALAGVGGYALGFAAKFAEIGITLALFKKTLATGAEEIAKAVAQATGREVAGATAGAAAQAAGGAAGAEAATTAGAGAMSMLALPAASAAMFAVLAGMEGSWERLHPKELHDAQARTTGAGLGQAVEGGANDDERSALADHPLFTHPQAPKQNGAGESPFALIKDLFETLRAAPSVHPDVKSVVDPKSSAATPSATPAKVDVAGTVTGQVDIMQSVRVDPSPLLVATVNQAKQVAATVQGSLKNKLGATMSGSNAAKSSLPVAVGAR